VLGGATIEVWARRETELYAFDISRNGVNGRVRYVDTKTAPTFVGTVLIATRDPVTGRDFTYRTKVDLSGRFTVSTPDFAKLTGPLTIEVYYSGGQDAGPAAAQVTVT
jgi:hypothetical protein